LALLCRGGGNDLRFDLSHVLSVRYLRPCDLYACSGFRVKLMGPDGLLSHGGERLHRDSFASVGRDSYVNCLLCGRARGLRLHELRPLAVKLIRF